MARPTAVHISGILLLAALVGCSGAGSKAEREAEVCLHGRMGVAIGIGSMTATAAPPMLCGPRAPAIDGDGRADCEVLVTFPTPGTIDAGADELPMGCDELPGLRDTGRTTEGGAPICEMAQVVRRNRELPEGEEGWYTVALSEAAMAPCGGDPGMVLAYSPQVRVPNGSLVQGTCSYALTPDDVTVAATDEACAVAAPAERSGEALSREVGQSCDPGSIVESFDDREILVTAASSECSSGACLVYQLHGAIAEPCGDGDEPRCVAEAVIDEHIYCTCRCSAPEGIELDDAELCTCPDDFTCLDGLFSQPDALAGGYCVRNGTF